MVGCIYIVNEGLWIEEEAAPNIMQSECSCAKHGAKDGTGITPMVLEQANPLCQTSIGVGRHMHSPALSLSHSKRKDETRFWSRIIITSNKLNSVLLNTHMAHQECAHNTSDSKLSARDSQLVRSGMSLVEGVGSKEELPRSSRTSFGAIRGCPHGEHQGPAAFQRRGEGRGGVGSKEELPRSNRTSFGAIRMESTRSSSSPEAGR